MILCHAVVVRGQCHRIIDASDDDAPLHQALYSLHFGGTRIHNIHPPIHGKSFIRGEEWSSMGWMIKCIVGKVCPIVSNQGGPQPLTATIWIWMRRWPPLSKVYPGTNHHHTGTRKSKDHTGKVAKRSPMMAFLTWCNYAPITSQ